MTMVVGPENRAIKDSQRIFVHMMVYQGYDRRVAYAQSHDIELNSKNEKEIMQKATSLFNRPNINKYYHALVQEISEKEEEKGLWTREIATRKLMRLIDKAEKDIYDSNKTLSMARLNAIVLPAKELNLMNGFNMSNHNIEGAVVHISGENELQE